MAATTFSVIVPIGPEYNLPNNNQRAYWTGAMQPNSHTGVTTLITEILISSLKWLAI